MSMCNYPHEAAALKRRGRCVVRLEYFSDGEMALIAQLKVPIEDARLDADLEDWKPESNVCVGTAFPGPLPTLPLV